MPSRVMTEKRRSPRVPAERGTRGVLRSTIQVAILDVSREGIAFHVASPLRPGATYAVTATLRGLTLSTQIRITRCKAAGSAKDGRGGQILVFQAGAEFVWSDPREEKALVEWLKKGGGAGPSATGDLVRT